MKLDHSKQKTALSSTQCVALHPHTTKLSIQQSSSMMMKNAYHAKMGNADFVQNHLIQ